MIDVKESLGHRIGPLPAYAWGIVVVGGYLGFRALTGRSGGASTVGGASAPLADLGATAGGSSGSDVTATPLHDIGVPGTYTGDPLNAYQAAVYAFVNGNGPDPGTYSAWVQQVINESGGVLQHTPIPNAPANPPPVTTGTGGTTTAAKTATFTKLSSGAVSYLSTNGSPLDAHQLHLLHIGSPIEVSLHQAHLLHLFTGR